MEIKNKLRKEIDYMSRGQDEVDKLVKSQIDEFKESGLLDFDINPREDLNLDTTKIDLSEYYFLTNQKFLKKLNGTNKIA